MNGSRARTLTSWLLASQLLAAGVSFVVNIIAAYGLTPDQRGLLAFYLQTGYLLTVFLMLGVEKPFAARIRNGFSNSTALLLRIVRPGYFIVASVFMTAGLLFIFGLDSIAIPLSLVAVFIVSNQHVRIIRTAYISSGTLKPFLSVVVITNGLTLVFALVLAIIQHGNFVVWLLAYVVANVTATFFVAHAARASRHDDFVREGPVRDIRRQGLRLLPGSLGNMAMFRPDRLLLPLLAGPAALGVYIVVSAALEVAVWPIQQWSDSKMNDWRDSKPSLDRRLRASILARAAVGVLGLSILCSAVLVVVVMWILPEGYEGALGLLAPITLANIVFGMARAQQGIAISENRSGLVSAAEVTGLLISVSAYFVLIPMLGGLGAALGSVIGNVVCFAVTETGSRVSNKRS